MSLKKIRQMQRLKAKKIAYVQAQVNLGRDFTKACAYVGERPEVMVWNIRFPRAQDAEE